MTTRIQAESLQRVGFRVESNSAASGSSLIGFAGGSANETGTASTGAGGLASFGLTSGTYDVYLGYFDENDGVGRIEVSLGGSLISGIDLNASLPSTAADRRTFVRRQIASGLTIDATNVLSIFGRENLGESTRIDYIEFVPVNNPTPTPGTLAFSSATYSVNENGTPVTTVTVTRTGGSSGAVSATVTPTNGTATAGSDFTSTPIVVNFAEGQTSQTVTIPITNDTDVEGNETINLTLSNPTGGATLGTQTTAILTIIDSNTPPATTRIEAESLTRTGSYRIEASSIASGGNLISFVGGATGETGAASRALSLASGTYDIVISYFDENDGTASLQVKLAGQTLDSWTLNQNLGNGGISTSNRVIRTIATNRVVNSGDLLEILGTEQGVEHARVDYIEFRPVSNPTPTPGTLAFSSATYSVNENGTPVTTVTVTRTGGSSGAISATVTPTNGTATAGNDFTSTPIVVNFAEGQTTQTVTIPITNDTDVEGNETVNLSLSNPTGGATLGTQTTATLTIIDNDSPGTLAFSSATYSVNENGTPVTTVTVTRTGGSIGAVSATVTPTNGTATAGSDFTSTPIVVNFAEGQTTQTVTIPILNDTQVESNETVNLSLSNPTGGATLGTQTTATLTIVDNDTPPPPIRIEAESLTRTGSYRSESNSIASGGRLISFVGGATGETGTAFGNLSLASGTYDIVISYFDENDGAASVQVKLAGQTLDSWTLNQNLGGSGISNGTRVIRTIATSRFVNNGDLLEILGTEQTEEHARIDYVEFRPVSTPTPPGGITIAPSGNSTDVTEGGNSDTYTLVLNSQPTANVTVAIASNSQVSTNLTSLTFTPTDWDQPRTITVNAVNDTVFESPVHTGTISHTTTSTDPRFNTISIPTLTVNVTDNERDLGAVGTVGKWQEIEINLPGPQSSESGNPNPFLISVDVTFTGPGGTFTVPAFYDGNGNGGSTGNIWKVRFSANSIGNWSFTTSSTNSLLNGYNGSFTVNTTPTSAPDLFRQGRLLYADSHYLRFADGGYWIKGGADDPEAILGTALGDFNAKRATIDYLASRGVNSVYIITNNVDGDGNDAWPWLGDTLATAKTNSTGSSTRFDISRLQQWEDFFTYVQSRNMVIHMVLEDDNAWSGYDRTLYYREMIARFGHLPGIIWNIGEEAEENYTDAQLRQFASQLRSLDPYDHPITVHRSTSNTWQFFGNSNFDLTSIEIDPPGGAELFSTTTIPNVNTFVINNRNASITQGRPIPISIDETPRVDVVNNSTRLKMRSEVLYPTYLAGGIYELHYYYQDPVTGAGGTVTPTQVEPMWTDMRYARQFVEALPFNTMAPNNALLSNTNGNYAFAQTGIAYGIYLRNGGSVDLDLSNVTGTYRVRWYNVTTGQYTAGGSIEGGDWRTLTSPLGANDVAIEVVNIANGNATTATPPIVGTEASETLVGDAIANVIHGVGGDDIVIGEAGDDILDGGAGNNTLEGGHGFDTADYSQATTGIVANLSNGRVLKPIYGGLSTPKIMPLGDSITAGEHTTNPVPGAYRIQLFNRFTQDGFGIDFVGSLSNGPANPFDPNHEGHRGWTMDQIRGLVDDPGFLESYQPDVILMMIGTNDAGNDFISLNEMKSDLEALITEITTRVPNTLLVVSTVSPAEDEVRNARIDAFNDEISGIVNTAAANNRRVAFVDVGGALELNDLTTDGLHPTQAGYDELGDRWYEAISDRDTLINIENIIGSPFQDTLVGNASVNSIEGGAGSDLLTGGAGADTFVYQQANHGGDTITDFSNQDVLQLSASGFNGLVAGMLLSTVDNSSGVFVSDANPTAVSTNPHVLYSTTTGVVSFDGDGLGIGATVAIATLQGAPNLTVNQIVIGV
ncbi:MAG: Calx-beta domain-containing protein [Oculatellaceae cyanobacterium bins.114]|nr:Calx-beta domain-containing protein [Oculatellaceae cyanobacterium bins.114]